MRADHPFRKLFVRISLIAIGYGEVFLMAESYRSAAGYVGMVKGTRGLLDPKCTEPGDFPNIFIGADGTGEMEVFSTFVFLVESPNNLLDTDGSTFVIHETGMNTSLSQLVDRVHVLPVGSLSLSLGYASTVELHLELIGSR